MTPRTKHSLKLIGIMGAGYFLWMFLFPTLRSRVWHEDEFDRLSSRGVWEMQAGNTAGAADLFAQASMLIESAPANDVRRATSLQNLAWVEEQHQHFDAATKMYHQAIAILAANGAAADKQRAAALVSLATSETGLHQFADATSAIKQAVQIDESTFGDKSPELAKDLRSYAEILLLSGRSDESIKVAQRAAVIDRLNSGISPISTTLPAY